MNVTVGLVKPDNAHATNNIAASLTNHRNRSIEDAVPFLPLLIFQFAGREIG